eukprot:TRINITY_DN35693_c0_g1_i1.p3 TRINITY_DN35693_c0_g1~~TRINITY_DN35693_c0_g1_i1.p3  ORF type:complete len:189 (-),score=2.50 TRINITY_DN35693_c0_g1_i1:238-732(-)
MQTSFQNTLRRNFQRSFGKSSTKRQRVCIASVEPVMQPTQTSETTPKQTVKKSSATSFFNVMKFNGLAPEVVNGRLAMLGFVTAAIREFQTGETILTQVQNASLLTWLWFALWVYASLVPMFKGARMEAFGWFTPRAEITNGRAAMLGFAIQLILEIQSDMSFF